MVIQCAFKECRPYLNELEARFGLAQWAEQSSGFSLHYDDKGLSLYKTDEPKLGAINVDFVTGAVAHRRKFGGGKGQSIAKAVGLNKGATPVVLDATAGLGRDGFVLASLGCKVILHERHPWLLHCYMMAYNVLITIVNWPMDAAKYEPYLWFKPYLTCPM